MLTHPDISGLSDWRPLARGGFARVWQARQVSLDRPVAVKVYQWTLSSEADKRRFLGEATVAGQLSTHPGIVTVHDAGILGDDHPYLVMELCAAGSLTRWLSPEHRPPEDRIRQVGVGIAEALAATHARGVLHRDVKPANILVTADGAPRLTDFGLAVSPRSGAGMAPLHALTPAYAPPEAIRGEAATELGDVFSLAATLVAVATGAPPRALTPDPETQPPATEPQARDVETHARDREPHARDVEPHRALVQLGDARATPWPRISSALASVLMRALSPEAKARPTAAEFRDQLLAPVLARTATSTVPAAAAPPRVAEDRSALGLLRAFNSHRPHSPGRPRHFPGHEVGRWGDPVATAISRASAGGKLTGLAFGRLSDGRGLLATGGADGTVRLWRADTGELVGKPITGHTLGVTGVAFGHLFDGRVLLASSSHDQTVRLWDPIDGTPVGKPLTGHTGWVTGVTFGHLRGGRMLVASSGHDQTVRLWDPVDGTSLGQPLIGHKNWVTGVAFGQLLNGRRLLASSSLDDSVRLWDLNQLTEARTSGPMAQLLSGHTDSVTGVAFGRLPNGRSLVASSSGDRTIRLWDAASQKPVARLTGHTDTVLGVTFTRLSGDRTVLASHSSDRSIRIWNLSDDRRSVSTFAVPVTPTSVAVTADVILAGSHEGAIALTQRR